MVWYSDLLFKNFPQFVVIHTVKGFSVVKEAEVESKKREKGIQCKQKSKENWNCTTHISQGRL